MIKNKKIAIVYDWIDKWGGVERVLLTLNEIFPQAVFFTSYYDKNKAFWAKNLKIKTSFIQSLPNFIKKNRLLSLPFYPIAFETFDFSYFDLVISVSSSFAKGVIVKPPKKHINYLLTPTRFLWVKQEDYYLKGFKKKLLFPYLNYLKNWDLIAAKKIDKIISISKTVQKRCEKYYQRKSQVIYPPFDIGYWRKIKLKVENHKVESLKVIKSKVESHKVKDYFLIVSRLEPYKKIDLVIKVFNKINKNLIIVGKGSEEKKLKKIANKKNILFLSELTDEELGYLYNQAEALLMPQEEDFGYVALESIFFNCPVISYSKGGATEIIINNKSGLFFDNQNEFSLIQIIEKFLKIKYKIKNNLKKFSFVYLKKFDKINFINKFKKIL